MSRDYGIRLSKPFYDATKAADSDLIFSSSWPSLPVATERTFTNSANGGDTSFASDFTFAHGLGFACFALIWEITNGVATQRPSIPPRIDLTSIYIDSPSTTASAYHVKCYNIDLSVNAEYPSTNASSVVTSYDNNYGIKIAKEDEDIDSEDMRDFILHSRCQSPLISVVKTSTGVSTALTYTDSKDYTAWVFGYVRSSSGVYTQAPYFNQAYPRLFITGSSGAYTYSITTDTSDDASTIVVLRDPMFASTNTEVTY